MRILLPKEAILYINAYKEATIGLEFAELAFYSNTFADASLTVLLM